MGGAVRGPRAGCGGWPRVCGGGDRGSAPALLVAALAVTALGLGTLGGLAQVSVARAHVRAAADLAALAGAERVALPSGLVLAAAATPADDAACRTATAVAERNGATLTGCRVLDGDVVEVVATAQTPVGDVTAVARAGRRAP